MNHFPRKTILALIRFFAYLHHYSYNKISALALYAESERHPKHRLTQYHHFFLNKIKAQDRVLDLGCGRGELTYALAQKAKFVLGIELNPKHLSFARKHHSAPNLRYIRGDITEGLPKKKFDVIILSNILEHLRYRSQFLSHLKEIAPKILVRVPLKDRDWLTLYKKELGLPWKLDKGHYTEYTLKSFQEESKKAGLILKKYSIQFGEIWAQLKSKP